MKRDLTGKQFGRLTVLAFAGRDSTGKDRWKCRCQCGVEKIVRGDHLLGGRSHSCRCLSREKAAENARTMGRKNVIHGGTATKLYSHWHKMKDRCQNPNHVAYKSYGGRGIAVCESWSNSFEAFRDWALANGYEAGLTLDRIDNSLGYGPNNCRWATSKQQAKNRSTSIVVDGKCLAEWARQSVISVSGFYRRIKKGWNVHDACTTPAGKEPK